ncbi:hypothetical protein MTR67_039973 [Solanum verrucosum]|uniref:Uncharacterized protein n=1 Tax=Solanum verrucosum TaxID=315347 RepID=A0AAF0UJJ4_SOLVR|nr:hypothetical protein MTR67_039973 [Solanum verrucosum]
MPGNTKGFLDSWGREWYLTNQKERWRVVPVYIWWTKCKERNQRCFKDKPCNTQRMKMKCLALYYFLCKQEYLVQTKNIFDVLDNR